LTRWPLTVTARCETNWRASARVLPNPIRYTTLSSRHSNSLQQILTGRALAARRFLVIIEELPFQHAVDAPQFLLFAQLQSVIGQDGDGARHAGRAAAPDCTWIPCGRAADFRNRSTPSRRLSLHFGTEISRHGIGLLRLYAPAFGGTATVMRDRRHVHDAHDLETGGVQARARRILDRAQAP
jgi:hypothetical protein